MSEKDKHPIIKKKNSLYLPYATVFFHRHANHRKREPILTTVGFPEDQRLKNRQSSSSSDGGDRLAPSCTQVTTPVTTSQDKV